jgi:hypothetical protein
MTDTRQKRRSDVRPDRPDLTLKRCGDGPDPRLIALVRLLARQAAREAYDEQMKERRKTRS